MDRRTIYAGQIPLASDQLLQSQNTMVALAKFSAAVLGQTTIVNAFTVTPTTPASLNVQLTAGEIYQLENLEASAWSGLGTDSHTILKQGILLDAATLGITPPGTVGYSQVFLVEVQYSDLDTGSTVLPYFNASNPPVPFAGPGNAGTAQNTVRKGIVAYQIKAGIAAATGTQVAPTQDAGWVGIYTITVANGATTITSGNISKVTAAPFLPVTLPGVPAGVQNGDWVYGVDTGTANNLVVASIWPPITAYKAGMGLRVKASAGPTGPCVINVSALGNVSLVNTDLSAIQANQWTTGSMLGLVYDGTRFQFVTSSRQPGQPIYLQANADYYVGGTGASDSNDGLSATVTGGHGPWATPQYAMDYLTRFNLNGNNITVHVANGTYASLALKALSGSGFVNWVGNTGSPGSVVIVGNQVSSISAGDCGKVHTCSGFAVTTTGSYVSDPMVGVHVYGAGTRLALSNMSYGACLGGHYSSEQNAVLILSGTETVTGGCAGSVGGNGAHASVSGGGQIQTAPNIACTVTTAVTFVAGWVSAGGSGSNLQILYSSLTGGGNVTGKRFSVATNAAVSTNGGGANYFPGTIAGTADTVTYGSYI